MISLSPACLPRPRSGPGPVGRGEVGVRGIFCQAQHELTLSMSKDHPYLKSSAELTWKPSPIKERLPLQKLSKVGARHQVLWNGY